MEIIGTGYGWVEWRIDVNRENFHGEGVGREPVVMEATLMFSVDLTRASSLPQAQQLVEINVGWITCRCVGTVTGNRGSDNAPVVLRVALL